MATSTNVLNYGGELAGVWTGDNATLGAQEDSTAKNPLGCIHRHGGNVYRYVYFDNGNGNVATVAGAPAYWYALNPATPTFTVTSDFSYGLGANAVAGYFLAAGTTDLRYIWIQVAGIIDAYVNASTVAGSRQIGGHDAVWDLASTNGENEVFGVSLESDTKQVAATRIVNCYW